MIEVAYPRQVVFVTSRGIADVMGKRLEKDNVMAASWHAPISWDPLLYGILISDKRFSYKLISGSKVFCVNFIPEKWEKECIIVGRESGMHQDKFAKAGLKTEHCDTIDCLRLKDALGYLECELFKEIELGDHLLLVGKVNKQWTNKEGRRLFQSDGNKFTTTRR
ncbi:flavin reductase family protein [Candidatus Woesearchaeota archaeon]|nr:flavin reductase family protein [Candidatus Woesearchaeota archaeon]